MKITVPRLVALTASVAVLAATGIGWTTAPVPASTQPATTVSIMSVPVPGVFQGVDFGTGHNGFPTVTELPDGRLRMMWRHGSGHASADGEILTSVGDPSGADWSEPERVIVDNGADIRDPHLGPSGLSTIDGEVFLTYFVTVNGVPSGARVARSADGGETFGPSVRIDPGFPWAAISSPVIKVNGKLWTAFYAKPPGESIESAYAAWSVNGGQSWSTVRIAIGMSGNPFQEPWAVAGANNSVVFVMRDGSWRSLATRSIDAAGAWAPLTRNVIANATGNSASVRASNGRIYLVYRDTVSRAAKLASSEDNGVTWTVERVLMVKPAGAAVGSVGMTYAHPIELGQGYLFCPVGMERGDGDSRLYLGFL
ncbi:MAG TPA: exo-alpha-sialidase [Propionibacteriaceae bacterium]|jgi:hypothetical protein|nr:exo-alpha-sialidase [Propionibacteriaceae bacterium]